MILGFSYEVEESKEAFKGETEDSFSRSGFLFNPIFKKRKSGLKRTKISHTLVDNLLRQLRSQ